MTESALPPIDLDAARNKRDANKYRLWQAQRLIDWFTAARGRPPATMEELVGFVTTERAKGNGPE